MAKLIDLFDDKLKVEHSLVINPPVNLNTIGSGSDDTAQAVINKIADLSRINYKVDYSDYSNFVFFNSALDYFNISGERILNEYPYDQGFANFWAFQSSSDGYQRYLFNNWPKYAGVFAPPLGSYAKIPNQAVVSGSALHGYLSPGTGSFTLEFWFRPPTTMSSNTSTIINFHDGNQPNPGFHVEYDGTKGSVYLLASGSGSPLSVAVSSTLAPTGSQAQFYSFSFDNILGTASLFVGSNTSRPTLIQSTTFTPGLNLNQTGSLELGDQFGTMQNWAIDNIRYWKTARNIFDVTVDYNTRIWASPGLYASWLFDDTESMKVLDYSGYKVNGFIVGNASSKTTGTLITSAVGEPILDMSNMSLLTYISNVQLSASEYDRNNDNIITKMFPEQYFILEDERQTNVLKNFLYVVARQMDFLKVAIDQFVYVTKVNYTEFNQTPDALLPEIAKFYGWDFIGNFLNEDAMKYFFGRGILSGSNESVPNQHLDIELFKIKNEFWRRTLNELMHIYKTKGTRESVEALIRVYGFDQKIVKLKEYGFFPNVGLQTNRINSHKSTTALWADGGSVPELPPTAIPDNGPLNMDQEFWIRFPLPTDNVRPATRETGSICCFSGSSWYNTPQSEHWTYSRPLSGANVITGTINFLYERSPTTVSATFPNLTIFDGKWYHMTLRRYVSGTDSRVGLDIRRLREDIIDYEYKQTHTVTGSAAGWTTHGFSLSSSMAPQGQYWINEIRHWHSPPDEIFALTEDEVVDHTLNMFSWGIDDPGDPDEIEFRWELNQQIDLSQSSPPVYIAFDTTSVRTDTNVVDQSGTFTNGPGVYDRFLFDYNYIAPPEYGWSEDVVRWISGTSVPQSQQSNQSNAVALEFNLIDALNEDISRIMVSLDNFNNTIGQPANRYRNEYPDLSWYRHRYFDRLQGKINFRQFADTLEFFDRTFIKMVQRLIPARATFLGDEFVIESHMLERPKHQYPYRRVNPEFQPEGTIVIIGHGSEGFAGSWVTPGGMIFTGAPPTALPSGSGLPFELPRPLGGVS